ncbi:hypothetical protein QN277_024815 [Acacia crassicarpa]|uniref:Uncharacterized protein n=1 Tax=Acacia crassicarpa TaxID=499986 RepID=A0AAE1K878_9FABA|nr:hypothetical protein QN277_024815 [Acacia crassicarpa]
MDKLEFPTPSNFCIYRVLPRLRKMNEAAYTPVSISIGPYHHGNKGLESMEEVKLWFLYKFLKRTQDKSVHDYVHLLKGQEGKIRQCYSETIPMESDEFVRMILTDACFIIEYFLLWHDENCWHSKLWFMWELTTTDLILLENQLPFFVLKDLFDLTFPDGYNELPFEFFTCDYLNRAFGSKIVPNEELQREFKFKCFVRHNLPTLHYGFPQVHHLCDLLRIFFVRRDDQRESSGKEMKPVYSVSKLYDAGIKFEVSEDEISLFKLKFSKGVLKIPKIIISDTTEATLRNVVAFEQYHFFFSRSMTDYIFLLGFLIITEKDVEILVEKGIIKNLMGENDAVASMIKRLGWNTSFTDFNEDYISLFEELNKFCDSYISTKQSSSNNTRALHGE